MKEQCSFGYEGLYAMNRCLPLGRIWLPAGPILMILRSGLEVIKLFFS